MQAGTVSRLRNSRRTRPADALRSIDASTILLLYALMVVSAQFRLGGFYTWTALRLTATMSRPARFLLLLMLVSAALSAVLANDIVCLAFTPVLTVALLRAGLNPLPFLLGLAVSSNIGSAATIIGNPQNMLIGQYQHLPFAGFLAWCTPPSLLALAAAYGIVLLVYRGRLQGTVRDPAGDTATWPELDRIANLIVIEQARQYGVRISFREHAATGIPVTFATVLITVAWIWLCG